MKSLLLAGDLGGTTTRLGIFSRERGINSPLAEERFASRNYRHFSDIVKEFLNRVNMPVNGACFGVAGPVRDGIAKITNLPWILDERAMIREFPLGRIKLMNDLEALAYAIPLLEEKDLSVLNEGSPVEGGVIAVLAPGTGLGEAFLTWNGTRYVVHASEGGHGDFAPNNVLEVELLAYLWTQFDHVSYERVCSGLGISNIYRFLRDRKHFEEPRWLAERLAAEKDNVPVIVNNALDEGNKVPLCVKTLDVFISILGAEAGNLALKVCATGGIFLGGGIPRRIVPLLKSGPFMESFLRKGRMSNLVAQIPVYVILNESSTLKGVAWYGMDLWCNEKEQGSVHMRGCS